MSRALLKLGIENISVFGLPPVAFVHLAAELGCQHISMGLTSFGYNPHGYPTFSLRDDIALRRDMNIAMRDSGIVISLAEGINIRPNVDVKSYAADLDIFCELGAERINTVSLDPDLVRSFDQFAVLAEMAGARGLITTTEFAPSLTVADLPTALAAHKHVGRADFRLLIDTMHAVRSGAGPADFARIDPALIDYVQVSDAPRVSPFNSYFEESMFQRMVPGEGELGLSELFAALPADRVYAIEVPLRREAEAGMGPRERLTKCLSATRRLHAEANREESKR